MSTPSSRLCPSRLSVSGTTVTDLVAASCGGKSAVESVTMAAGRLLKGANPIPAFEALGSNVDRRRIVVAALLVLEEAVLDRPHADEEHEHDEGREHGDTVVAKADRHA